jgi:hypothetical protein
LGALIREAVVEKHRRIQAACIIGLVLAFHFCLFWFLLADSRVVIRPSDSQGLQIVLIPRPPAPADASTAPAQKALARQAAVRSPASSSAEPTKASAPPADESNAIHPPIDWGAELSQAAKAAAADQSAQTPRDFGFPKMPAAPEKPPQFEWDYAATHRVEQVEGGGLLVHLNDQCVLVLFPLPFMGCGIGTKPANGDLFKNMNAPPRAQPGTAP